MLGSHSPARSSLSAVRVCVCACCMPSVRAGVCSRGVCALVCVSVCTIACEHVALNSVTEGEGGKGRRRKGKGKKSVPWLILPTVQETSPHFIDEETEGHYVFCPQHSRAVAFPLDLPDPSPDSFPVPSVTPSGCRCRAQTVQYTFLCPWTVCLVFLSRAPGSPAIRPPEASYEQLCRRPRPDGVPGQGQSLDPTGLRTRRRWPGKGHWEL